jgi:hypothetical protein
VAALVAMKNLRVVATTPHSVTLAWDPAVNSGSFTDVIEASFGYRVGVPQTRTSYTWTRDMIPGEPTRSSCGRGREGPGVREAQHGDSHAARGHHAAGRSGCLSDRHDLVDRGPRLDRVADDDSTCCKYRVFANGNLVSTDNLQWTGERAVTVLRLAAATTHSFTVVAVDPSGNTSAPSAALTATTEPTTDTAGPTAPGDLSAWDFGCETWLFWNESVDDVDSPTSSVTLTDQAC